MLPALDDALSTVGSVTVMLVDEVHPLASVTVYEYVPAVTVLAPVPVYAPVPPVAETVTEVEPPLQAMLPEVDEATKSAGSATVMLVDAVQPLASVTVYEYVPAVTVLAPVPV